MERSVQFGGKGGITFKSFVNKKYLRSSSSFELISCLIWSLTQNFFLIRLDHASCYLMDKCGSKPIADYLVYPWYKRQDVFEDKEAADETKEEASPKVTSALLPDSLILN